MGNNSKMILKLMGLMDILSVLILLLFKYGIISQKFVIIATIYLAIKGIIFFRNVVSLADFGVAVIFVLALFGVYNVLTWIAMIWILQKAILSLFS